MIIARLVTECDFTERKYNPAIMGAAYITKSAIGDWCEIMHAGPEFLEANQSKVLSYDEAIALIESEGGEIRF